MNTILLVEDNIDNITLLEDAFLFDDIPAQLVVVESGEEAVNKAVEIKPALILMDLRLPGMDGLETTRILKCNPQTRDIPVWALTAYAMNSDEEQAKAAGCSEYFTKPTNFQELSDQLRTFLDELERWKVLS